MNQVINGYAPMFEPEEVLFINLDNKALPFQKANLITPHTILKLSDLITLVTNGENVLDLLPDIHKYKLIFNDTFTGLLDHIAMSLINKFEGYDYWREYNRKIRAVLTLFNKFNNFLVWTAHEDDKMDFRGIRSKTVKLQGKELYGLIPNYFVNVFWTHFNIDGKRYPDRFQFQWLWDGVGESKALYGVFDKEFIPNDLNYVFHKILEFYKVKSVDELHKAPNILIVGKSGSGKSYSMYNVIKG